ncbi:MAG: hypothetical protein LBJ21_01005 [Acidobacteriota bacterium]|jgi:hypothetical protein|nr:hypothetical protein [Acidobacteriota bacterium]
MNSLKLPAAVLCCALCVFFSGCARIAAPKPPERRVPETVRDLEARQTGEEITLTFSLPERNTDGSPARTIRSLEIFRITEKAGAEIPAFSAELSEENFLDRAAHIFSIPASRFEEYTRGNVFVIRDAPRVAPGESFHSLRFIYAAVFVNEKNQAAGLGRRAVVQPVVLPPAPEGLAAVLTEKEIRVTWTPPPESANAARPFRIAYNIYRSENPDEFPLAPANGAPIQAAEYADSDFQLDKTYYYAVSVAAASNPPAESGRSEILKVEARDIFPPLSPGSFTVIAGNGKVTLFWTPSPSPDVAGYRIFRKDRAGSRKPLRDELITGISYVDENTDPDGAYIYEIQAVDGRGNAGETIEGNL